MKQLFFILLMFSSRIFAQEEWQKAETTECYFSEENAFRQLLPENSQANLRLKSTSTIEIVYEGEVPANAKTAIEYAKNIWANYLISSQVIRIRIAWTALSGSTLAQTSSNRIYKNFTNSIPNLWYPVALAESLAGKNLNATEDEMNISLNSDVNWYYGTDAKIQAGKYDLVTVLLHEMAHGLGFSSSFQLTANNTQAQYGQSGSALIYDSFLQNLSKQKLTNATIFGNPSVELKNAITNNAVYFGLKNPALQNALPKLYAPSTFKLGSSLSHFDETAYPLGNENALLSPTVRAAEAIHRVGTLILHTLNEMGWQINGLDGYYILANEPTAKKGYDIFPNPVENELIIRDLQENDFRNTRLELIDLMGKKYIELQMIPSNNHQIELDMSELSSGIYFIRIIENNNVFTKRIIKM